EELGEALRLEAVYPTGELLLPEWEQTIRRVFRCAVLPYYGCGEVNSLGYHVRQGEGYRIPEEHAVIEVQDAGGEARLEGDGRFLVTELEQYAMPIIRYMSGDAGRIAPPEDGEPFSRIARLDGRYNSLLMTSGGDLISGVIGTHTFRYFPTVESYR